MKRKLIPVKVEVTIPLEPFCVSGKNRCKFFAPAGEIFSYYNISAGYCGYFDEIWSGATNHPIKCLQCIDKLSATSAPETEEELIARCKKEANKRKVEKTQTTIPLEVKKEN